MTGFRIGHGYDVHRLVSGRPLVLGGVALDFDKGLEGHSDADCAVHALCDAILGAAAAGDMGRHFPSGDPRWKGASSLTFLTEVVRLAAERRLGVRNADLTVIAEAPRLAPHLERMRAVLSSAMGIDPACVSVKCKSTDGLGSIGRGDGIAALATVLLGAVGEDETRRWT
jgi:2-C-methyl-D-erythritol 2,4-cyclodiphosphate synthase